MLLSMYTGIAGMKGAQDALSITSNNIANSQTAGYKAQSAIFQELIYQQWKTPAAGSPDYAGTNGIMLGSGSKLAGTSTNFKNGIINFTGNKTDLAIEGNGYFVVGNANGQNNMYTRAGNFVLSNKYDLVTQNGQYVLGWMADPVNGSINAGGAVGPIHIPIGQTSVPNQSTNAVLQGNLNVSMKKEEIYNVQVPTFDRLGGRHDVSVNYIPMGNNTFKYVAIPNDQFKKSAGIESATMQLSDKIAGSLKKGDYQLNVAPGAAGTVDITVLDPDGNTVLTKNVADVDQKLTLDDGTNSWFAIDYKGGKGATSSTFTVGDVGQVKFSASGKVQTATSDSGGDPTVDYTPDTTGTGVSVKLDMSLLTSLATDSKVGVAKTDGKGAGTLIDFSVGDGGRIVGLYSDGTMGDIGQVAVAAFSNPAGLIPSSSGYYTTSGNSGEPEIGIPGTGGRGKVTGSAVEMSNVDLSKEFVDLMMYQKAITGNSKIIRVGDDVLTTIVGLIR